MVRLVSSRRVRLRRVATQLPRVFVDVPVCARAPECVQALVSKYVMGDVNFNWSIRKSPRTRMCLFARTSGG